MTVRERHDSLLEGQLLEALADVSQGVDPVEVAALGGLVERFRKGSPALDAADLWCDGPGAGLLARQLIAVNVRRLVDHLLEPEHDEDERADALFAVDEACAALTYAGDEARARSAVAAAIDAIHALPAPWAPFASLAARTLEEAPPLQGDPALQLWRAVEATAFPERPLFEGAPRQVVIPTLLRATVTVTAQAAGVLGRDPMSVSVQIGCGATLTAHQAEEAVLFLEVTPQTRVVAAERDGQPVDLRKVRATTYSGPYVPGTYVFQIDGTPCLVEVR